ncbi:MAG: aminopeptidase P family protein [Nitrospirae bacterium]|nr:aminopeptidase P family protein [Nitrospirota bacterium]
MVNGSGNRIKSLKDSSPKKKGNAFLITNLRNIRYMTGFTGSNGALLISGAGDFFFTDFRYKEQSAEEVKSCEVVISKKDFFGFIIKFINKLNLWKILLEDTIQYKDYARVSKHFTVSTTTDLVENLRSIKDQDELKLIKEAIRRAESAFTSVKAFIKPGITERAIANRMEEKLKQEGTEAIPFDTIVASGKRSALPHARPSEKKLQRGDLVVVDWGAECGGYFSDMTRTLLINGEGLDKKREIYDIVLRANSMATRKVKTGLTGAEIDDAARGSIRSAGYGEYFGHGTGHGVGLDVHEKPYISATATKLTLSSGMVFTIEPGIYIPGLGGVRIEDMVVVSGEGTGEKMTTLPEELETIW